MTLKNPHHLDQKLIDLLIASIEQLRFGSVEITVHDGRITQIEKREQVRFGTESQRATPTVQTAVNFSKK